MAAVPVPASSTFVSRLREDVVGGLSSVLFTTVLGAPLLPRAARRALLNAAGAQVESGPNAQFSLNGSARNLRIGRGVYFNTRVDIEAIAPVTIGDHTAIGMQVLILTSHHAIGSDGSWSRTADARCPSANGCGSADVPRSSRARASTTTSSSQPAPSSPATSSPTASTRACRPGASVSWHGRRTRRTRQRSPTSAERARTERAQNERPRTFEPVPPHHPSVPGSPLNGPTTRDVIQPP
jgi:hypothetical protein